MAHHNRENPFLNLTASKDLGLLIVQTACFGFLAVTTAVMAWGSFHSPIANALPDQFRWAVIPLTIAAVAIVYLIIDHHLAADFMGHWRTNSQLKTGAVTVANPRAAKAFSGLSGALLLVRLALTLTASVWAGDEIADLSTTPPDFNAYAEKVMQHEQLMAEQTAAATAKVDQAEKEKQQAIADADAEGQQLIAQAIESGNIHQRDMWKRNPGFFQPPPRGKYYQSNKRYFERIQAAKDKAAALLASAQGVDADAKMLMASITAKVASDSTATLLAGMAAAAQENHQITTSRKRRLVIRLDVIAVLVGFLTLRIRFTRFRAAGFSQPAEKRNLPSIIAQWRDKQTDAALHWLETMLNLDVDGDGHIGAPPATASSSRNHGPFFRNQAAPPYLPHDDDRIVVKGFAGRHEKPLSSPRYALATPKPDQGGTLGHDAEKVAANRLLGAYRSTMSNIKAAQTRAQTDQRDQYLSDQKSILRQIEIDLVEMGFIVGKRTGKTGAYFLKPINVA